MTRLSPTWRFHFTFRTLSIILCITSPVPRSCVHPFSQTSYHKSVPKETRVAWLTVVATPSGRARCRASEKEREREREREHAHSGGLGSQESSSTTLTQCDSTRDLDRTSVADPKIVSRRESLLARGNETFRAIWTLFLNQREFLRLSSRTFDSVLSTEAT